MPPVTKQARLCQNSLPKSILWSLTRWCPRNLQSFARILVNCRGRHRSYNLSWSYRNRRLTAGYASIIQINHCDDYLENENRGQHSNTCYALPLRSGMSILLSPCASLFPSLFLSNIFINMTVIMPPVTKQARLCQNSLPKSILWSLTRWCPRNLQSFARILVNCRGRHRSYNLSWSYRNRRLTAGYASIIQINHCDDYIENENRGQHTCYALPLRQRFKW